MSSWTKKRFTLTVLSLAAVLVFAILASIFVVYQDRAFLCQNTGSRKGYREWFFGLQTGNWYSPSAVEALMKEKYPRELEYRWTSYAGTGKNVYGFGIVYSHGRVGPLIQIKLNRLNEWF